ncbi:MAG TPA: glutamate ligase, partial [Clostridia bacterium]|nr:glutamate ligase [Clostridia bacterium]
VDDSELISFLQGMKHYFITYGFNSKASLTTSSIGDSVFKDEFLCCLQRSIPTNNGMLVEPQEFRLNVQPEYMDPYSVLAAAAFAVVNGIDLNLLNNEGQKHIF